MGPTPPVTGRIEIETVLTPSGARGFDGADDARLRATVVQRSLPPSGVFSHPRSVTR
jgi:hypothetical protein